MGKPFPVRGKRPWIFRGLELESLRADGGSFGEAWRRTLATAVGSTEGNVGCFCRVF